MNRNQGDQVGDYIMWEDDRVRVWDQVIQPGETVGPHTHKLDYFIVTLENAEVTAEVFGENHSEVKVIENGVYWVQSNGENHTATNVDKQGRRWRNLIIEIKQPAGKRRGGRRAVRKAAARKPARSMARAKARAR